MAEALTGLDLASGRVRVTQAAAPSGHIADALERVTTLLGAGKPYEAIADAAVTVRAWPGEPLAYERLAAALRYRSLLVEAEASLRTALDLDGANVELRYQLGLVLQGRGQLGAAVAEWQATLERSPQHGPSHARLAVAFFLLGDHGRAATEARLAERFGTPAPPQLGPLLSGQPALAVEGGAGILPQALPPVRVDAGGISQAAETILATGDGLALASAWNDLRQAGPGGEWRLGVATSLDGGSTWTDRILRAPGGLADDFEGDPMVAHDPRTGNQWAGGILFGYVHQRPGVLYLARRQPGTQSFFPAVTVHGASFIDKALLAAGPRPGLPNTTRLYVTYNLGLQRSDDLGATWSAPVPFGGGIGPMPRVGPNGGLYAADWDGNLEHRLIRSLDGGVTIDPPRTLATRLDLWSTAETSHVPGSFRVAPLPYLAVDPNDGALYAVYADSTGTSGGEENVDLYFTRSNDGGQSWTVPRVIHGDSTPPRDQFHPWLEVGADGRLHLAFFDTRSTPQLDADANAFLDVYYATSGDHGDTWAEMRVTPQPFESQFAAWPGFTDQFVGDYIGMSVVGDRVFLLYPSTANGNLDVFCQILDYNLIFADGFESGDVSAWDTVVTGAAR